MRLRFLTIIFSVLTFEVSYSQIHDFETTRLKSTGGIGVASILLQEATVLNPAPLAFFGEASIYFHRSQTDIKSSDSANQRSLADSDNMGIILSDTKSGLKGSFGYVTQDEGFNSRKRFSAAMAHLIGKKSAIGATFHHTKEKLSPNGSTFREEKYNQGVLGVSHAISEDFTTGLVVVDPLKERPDETRAILGLQYVIKKYVTLIVDAGADYNRDLNETFQYGGAVQVKIWNDFFVRSGFFENKRLSERGNGIGLTWIQPRLIIEGAFKNTRVSENALKDIKQENIKEASFSLALRF